MPDNDAFEVSFCRLRTVLRHHADDLVVTKDEPALYYLVIEL